MLVYYLQGNLPDYPIFVWLFKARIFNHNSADWVLSIYGDRHDTVIRFLLYLLKYSFFYYLQPLYIGTCNSDACHSNDSQNEKMTKILFESPIPMLLLTIVNLI